MLAKEHRARARQSLKPQFKDMLLIALVYEVICAGITFIPVIGGIASLLLQGPLVCGFILVTLKVIRNQKAELNDLFTPFKDFLNLFLLHLLNGIFVALWSLLLFVPGVMKAYSYSMSYYIAIENPGMDQKEARIKSMELMNGHRMDLFILHFSFIGWGILLGLIVGLASAPIYGLLGTYWGTVISSVIGIIPSILLLPYITCATSSFYEELTRGNNANVDYTNVVEGDFEIKNETYNPEDLNNNQ